MKAIILAVLAINLLLPHALTAQNCWLQKPDIPGQGRYSGVGFSTGEKGYVGLGSAGSSFYMSDFYEYTIQSGNWVQKASFPGQGLYSPTAFSINGIGYVCCGFSNSAVCQTEVWAYDPATDIWTPMAPFPGQARYGASACVIGDSAYLVAGSYNIGSSYLYDLWMYNSSNDTWTQKADFPGTNRSHGVAFSIGGKAYFGTGMAETNIAASDFWQYDPVSNIWSAIANFPGMPRMGAVSYVINDNGFVGSGYDLVNEYNDFWRYEPVTNSWIVSCPVTGASGRRVGICFTLLHLGFYGAGYSEDNGALSDFWEFRPTLEVPENEEANTRIDIYPNPNNGIFSIEAPGGGIDGGMIRIYDITGKLCHNQLIEITAENTYECKTRLNQGYYSISIHRNGLPDVSRKLIISY